jgi:hypothetical protein
VDAIKAACEGSVVLVDHTGFGPQDRARGHSSVLAAMDTEIRVTYDRQNGVATAEVTRDKAAEIGKYWQYKLSTVQLPTNDELVTHSAAVPVPMTEGDRRSDAVTGDNDWWRNLHEPDRALPQHVVDRLKATETCTLDKCPRDGHNDAPRRAAHDVCRVLVSGAGESGLTRAEVWKAIAAAFRAGHRPADDQYSEPTMKVACNMLEKHGVIDGGTRGKAHMTIVPA